MIDVQCPSCSKAYRLSDDKAGKKFRCRDCQAVVAIPVGGDFDLGGGYDDYGADDYEASSSGDAFDDAFSPAPRGGSNRPRARRRKPVKKSGSKAGVIIGAIAGGGIVVTLVIVGIVFAVQNFGGSANYKKHEKIANDTVDQMRELSAALESVTDRNSAKAAAIRINKVCDRLEEIMAEEKKLPRLTRSEHRRLKEKVDKETKQLDSEIEGIGRRAGIASQGEPSFIASAQRLITVANRLGQMGGGVR